MHFHIDSDVGVKIDTDGMAALTLNGSLPQFLLEESRQVAQSGRPLALVDGQCLRIRPSGLSDPESGSGQHGAG